MCICGNGTGVYECMCVQMGVGMGRAGGGGVGVACRHMCAYMQKFSFFNIIMFTYYRALSVQTSHLSEDLRAREEQVKSLRQQLK